MPGEKQTILVASTGNARNGQSYYLLLAAYYLTYGGNPPYRIDRRTCTMKWEIRVKGTCLVPLSATMGTALEGRSRERPSGRVRLLVSPDVSFRYFAIHAEGAICSKGHASVGSHSPPDGGRFPVSGVDLDGPSRDCHAPHGSAPSPSLGGLRGGRVGNWMDSAHLVHGTALSHDHGADRLVRARCGGDARRWRSVSRIRCR